MNELAQLKEQFDINGEKMSQSFVSFTEREKCIVISVEKKLQEKYNVRPGTAIAMACSVLLDSLRGIDEGV